MKAIVTSVVIVAIILTFGCGETPPRGPDDKALDAVKSECEKGLIDTDTEGWTWVVYKNKGSVQTEPENSGYIVNLNQEGKLYAKWIVFGNENVMCLSGFAKELTAGCEFYYEPKPKFLDGEDLEELEESGIPEETRKEIYYELVKYQDSISYDDPLHMQKMEGSYKVIADRYDITDEEVSKITFEGSDKNWPMPLPPY